MTWRDDSEGVRARFAPDVVVRGAVLTLSLTLFLGLILLPAVAVVGVALSELVLFGVLLLASSLVRIAAGLFSARMYRRRLGTDARSEALPSVLAAMAFAWAMYALLVVASAALTGANVAVGRLLLELPRWLMEGAVGAGLVPPGEPERLDPRLRRYALLDRDGR